MRQLNIRTKSRLGYAFLAAITLILTILGVIGAKLYLLVAAIAVYLLAGVFFIQWITGKIHWYEGILDSIPFPLSITDAQRRWTFINKPVEDMLGVKRADMLGKQCDNWGAGICNTDNCGINCLKRGKTSTTFEQGGMDFKVDVSYLTNPKGHVIGHIEVVQDISRIVKTQKAEAEIVVSIARVSDSFVSGTGRIADGAAILASGSAQQTATIEELSNSVTELTEQTKRNAEMAEKAARLAGTIKHNAEKGSRQMEEMMAAVAEINKAGQDISKVIKVIDDIAFQTNILALNAAVEAARAGQHGKGFAVVADEVRNLAAKSAVAAKETGNLIANSIEKAELGSRIAGDTAASLAEIVSGIDESNRITNEIAVSSEEQSGGIEQINHSIEQVANVVQQNSATAEESAAASEEMSGQADMLKQLISNFRLRNQESPSPVPYRADTTAYSDESGFALASGYGGKY